MKTSLLLGVAATALILAAPQASAAGYKPYVSVFGGASVLTKNPHGQFVGTGNFDLLMDNPGYIVGGAVGVDWGNQLRTEIELSHAQWTSSKFHYNTGSTGTKTVNNDASATYLLGNGWLDLSHGTMLTPYVGGGLGIGWANVTAFNSPKVKSVDHFGASGLAFQLGAGVRFNVSNNVSIDAGYRFKDIVNLNYSAAASGDTLTDTSLASHNFQIGLTYEF